MKIKRCTKTKVYKSKIKPIEGVLEEPLEVFVMVTYTQQKKIWKSQPA